MSKPTAEAQREPDSLCPFDEKVTCSSTTGCSNCEIWQRVIGDVNEEFIEGVD